MAQEHTLLTGVTVSLEDMQSTLAHSIAHKGYETEGDEALHVYLAALRAKGEEDVVIVSKEMLDTLCSQHTQMYELLQKEHEMLKQMHQEREQ